MAGPGAPQMSEFLRAPPSAPSAWLTGLLGAPSTPVMDASTSKNGKTSAPPPSAALPLPATAAKNASAAATLSSEADLTQPPVPSSLPMPAAVSTSPPKANVAPAKAAQTGALQFFHPSELKLGKVLPPQVADRRIGKSVGLTVRKARNPEVEDAVVEMAAAEQVSDDEGIGGGGAGVEQQDDDLHTPNEVPPADLNFVVPVDTPAAPPVSVATPIATGNPTPRIGDQEQRIAAVASSLGDTTNRPPNPAPVRERLPTELPQHMQVPVMDRASYYRHYFDIGDSDEEVAGVCHEYLRGLAWVTTCVCCRKNFLRQAESIFERTSAASETMLAYECLTWFTGTTLKGFGRGHGSIHTLQHRSHLIWWNLLAFRALSRPTRPRRRLSSCLQCSRPRAPCSSLSPFARCFMAHWQSITRLSLRGFRTHVGGNGGRFYCLGS
jgi:hypothetical protein